MIQAKKAKGLWKIFGLMFRTRKTSPLLFEFKDDVHLAIHSFFVFFSFRAIWLDENNKIIEQRIVRPFAFYVRPRKPFRKLIEVPEK
jgi:uncharacterized membrane protein (UPF0127 family)